MKWRCEWCGKPHEEDDPPCDSCGHGKFEKAIVPEPDYETVDTGTTYVWTCPNCGREHVKNNPPCSRCGEPELEKAEQSYEDVERDLETPSWFEAARPYLPAFALIALVAVLFGTGIVSPSIVPGIGSPTPPDSPGEGTEAAGIDLEVAEREVHERLEADREASRSYDGGLAAYTEYRNHLRAIAAEEGDDPDVPPSVTEFDPSCTGDTLAFGEFTLEDPIESYDGDGELADDVAATLLTGYEDEVRTEFGVEGLDIHVGADGEPVFVAYAAC